MRKTEQYELGPNELREAVIEWVRDHQDGYLDLNDDSLVFLFKDSHGDIVNLHTVRVETKEGEPE